MQHTREFAKVTWMLFWRLFILVSIVHPYGGLNVLLVLLMSLAGSGVIVYYFHRTLYTFPLIRSVFRHGASRVLHPDHGPQHTPPQPTYPQQPTQSQSQSRGTMTGFEPHNLKTVHTPIGRNTFGVPGSSLQQSSLSQHNTKLGVRGEELFAKSLVKEGLASVMDSYWSVAMPSENSFVPDSTLKTDIDCVLAFDNTVILVDVKYYTGGNVTYRDNGQHIFCFDNETGNEIGQSKVMSKNMQTAYTRFHHLLPRGTQLYALVVFVPTDRGAATVDDVTWPGNIPAVNLLDMINYLKKETHEDYAVNKQLRRKMQSLIK